MRYFINIDNVEDLKKEFYKAAKDLHPDNGGDPEEFKIMINEYNDLFNRLKNTHKTAEGKKHQKETDEQAGLYRDIIMSVITFTGINIEICGSWVWLTGNTYIYRDKIKMAGFKWSNNKKAWYWSADLDSKRRRGHYNFKRIREIYGSVEVETKGTLALN